jgi:hypothetical protein
MTCRDGTDYVIQAIENVGAGEGNRTLVISLEGCCSTIELHPRRGQSSDVVDPVVRLEIDLCFSRDGGGGRTRTYEGVSQRIYSPPPLPLGTLPRRRTSHPCGRAFPSAGRGYGERLARCQPRENGAGRSP